MSGSHGFWARGGGWVSIQWVLMIGSLVAAPFLPGDWNGYGSQVGAIVLGLAGSTFGISGAWMLGRNRTIFPEPKPGSRLVSHGIYGFVRHPLYTSVILLLVAWALGWRSFAALFLAAVTAGFLDAKARYEERRLLLRFPGYQDYARRVKRLIPFVY